jgi:hypothetical protein
MRPVILIVTSHEAHYLARHLGWFIEHYARRLWLASPAPF